jgi:hypothetical protein
MNEETAHDEEMVTVASFQTAAEADLARLAIQAAGIETFLLGENANRVIASATELQVRSSDAAAAREVLNEAETSPASEAEVTAAEIASETAAG